MHRQGVSVTEMSSATRVRREQVEIIVASVDAGTFKGIREMTAPKTAMDVQRDEIAALKAELDGLKTKAGYDHIPLNKSGSELSPQKRAADTRKANALAALKE